MGACSNRVQLSFEGKSGRLVIKRINLLTYDKTYKEFKCAVFASPVKHDNG